MAIGKKGEAKRLKVILSASYCLCHYGEKGTTFQAIAEHCQVSQASVVRYLTSIENIFPTVLNYWLEYARKKTEAELEKSATPEQKLRRYLNISTAVFFGHPDICKIYLMLHYFAAVNERYKVINSDIKYIAQERIAQIIQDGIDDSSFKHVDVRATAKTIHNSLVGLLISSVTEIKKPIDLHLPSFFEEYSLSLVLKKLKAHKV